MSLSLLRRPPRPATAAALARHLCAASSSSTSSTLSRQSAPTSATTALEQPRRFSDAPQQQPRRELSSLPAASHANATSTAAAAAMTTNPGLIRTITTSSLRSSSSSSTNTTSSPLSSSSTTRTTLLSRPRRSFSSSSSYSRSPSPLSRPPRIEDSDSRRHREERIVPFSPSQLFSVVSDVDNYSHFVPWCTDSRVTARHNTSDEDSDNNNFLVADLSVGFRLLSETYTSVVTIVPNRSVSVDVPNSALFDYLITDWTFDAVANDPGRTALSFYVEFRFRNPLYRRVTDLFFEEVVKQMVSAFERQCHRKFRRHHHHHHHQRLNNNREGGGIVSVGNNNSNVTSSSSSTSVAAAAGVTTNDVLDEHQHRMSNGAILHRW